MGVTDFAASAARPDHLKFFVTLDFGQSNDRFAVGVLERRLSEGERDRVTFARAELVRFDLRHLERFPVGCSYVVMVARVGELLESLAVRFPGVDVDVIYDRTGVGVAVGDLLRDSEFFRRQALLPRSFFRLVGVTLHGGSNVLFKPEGGVSVPKRDLISAAVVLLQRGLLRVAAQIPEREALISELVNFKAFISASGHDSYGNDGKRSKNDDCVTVVALAAWAAQRDRRPGAYLGAPAALPCQYN